MIVVWLLISLLWIFGRCQEIMISEDQIDIETSQCIIRILDQYFSKRKELTYVNMNPNDEDQHLLKVIHSTLKFSLITRESTHPMLTPNQGYLIYASNKDVFVEYFEELIREPTWNPYARFLIIIKSLQEEKLRQVFDVLLRLHVINVLLVNGTEDAHLYAYNPFDNNACGRYYNTIINYGQCSKNTQNLYPNKLVSGLKNCTFRGSLIHRPPFCIDPSKNDYRNKLPGMEQFVLKTASEVDEFKIDFKFDYNGSTFSTVAPNMTAIGPMDMLQKNQTDVVFGSMMVLVTRATGFSYLGGYHDYVDEFKIAVKKSSFVPNWQNFYLEFDVIVWILLFVTFLVYSGFIMLLLQREGELKDKGDLVLRLLDNLLVHGRDIRCPLRIKCVLLMWVWFAYLVNTFYQSSLVSLTTNPSKEYQISDENEMFKYHIRPCLGPLFVANVITDAKKKKYYEKYHVKNEDCDDIVPAMKVVTKNKDMYTIIPSFSSLFNKQAFNDKWGDPLLYYFDKTFSKLLFGMYFYKGFPISPRLRKTMLRLRENGLANKNLQDQYFMRSIRFSFSQKEFESRFVFPWCVYVAGCLLATAAFIGELLSVSYLKQRRKLNKRKERRRRTKAFSHLPYL